VQEIAALPKVLVLVEAIKAPWLLCTSNAAKPHLEVALY
jgi:hypothetical protein